jgi:hypothetical protein
LPTNQLANQLANQPIGQSTCQPTNLPINLPTNQLANQPTCPTYLGCQIPQQARHDAQHANHRESENEVPQQVANGKTGLAPVECLEAVPETPRVAIFVFVGQSPNDALILGTVEWERNRKIQDHVA